MDEALGGTPPPSSRVELGNRRLSSTITDKWAAAFPSNPHSEISEEVGASKSSCARCMPAANSIPRSMRPRGGPARRRHLGGQRPSPSRLRGRSRPRPESFIAWAFERGLPKGKLEDLGKINNRRGTRGALQAGQRHLRPPRRRSSRSGCFKDGAPPRPICSGGVEIRWRCASELAQGHRGCAGRGTAFLHFPGGLERIISPPRDPLPTRLVHPDIFSGKSGRKRRPPPAPANGRWRGRADADGFLVLLLQTPFPTQDGGTHESGMRRRDACGGLKGPRRARSARAKRAAASVTSRRDVHGGRGPVMLSVFVGREPGIPRGQTKDRLAHRRRPSAIVEQAIKDPFDHLAVRQSAAGQPAARLSWSRRAEETACAARAEKGDFAPKPATKKLRLPGKLADCTNTRDRRPPSSSSSRATFGRRLAAKAGRATARARAVMPLRGKNPQRRFPPGQGTS